jgi:hypothetical protein
VSTNQQCPVCKRPYTLQERFCPQCGWDLAGEYILGRITPAKRNAFQHELTVARQEWQARQHDIDLVCIIDLIGDTKTIQKRRKFASDLIQAIQQRLEATVTLHVGLLAYGDYNHIKAERHRQHPAPVQFHPLDKPEIILEQIQALEPQTGQDFEAALEDALAKLGEFHWSLQSSRFMTIVGNRPPHPYRPVRGWEQIGSPSKRNWHVLIEQARSDHIHSIAIVFPIWSPRGGRFPRHIQRYADHCWREIGYTALFHYGKITHEEVAQQFIRIYAGSRKKT